MTFVVATGLLDEWPSNHRYRPRRPPRSVQKVSVLGDGVGAPIVNQETHCPYEKNAMQI